MFIIPILQMKKLRHEEVKLLNTGHTASIKYVKSLQSDVKGGMGAERRGP